MTFTLEPFWVGYLVGGIVGCLITALWGAFVEWSRR